MRTQRLPEALTEYLELYGWHFNKKLCDFAVSEMRKEDGKKIVPYTKESVDMLLKKYNIELKHKHGYDYVFVANMAKADYFGSSIVDEAHLALFIKDYCDDPDGYPELPLSRYYADTMGKDITIVWEDMI